MRINSIFHVVAAFVRFRLRGGFALRLLAKVMASVSIAPLIMALAVPAAAAGPMDAAPTNSPVEFPVPAGRFFTQTNGQGGGNSLGYKVTDDSTAQFWTAFQRMGGVGVVGYPVSQRFEWKGLVTQAFQKLVLQWHPGTKNAVPVNIFDEMAWAGTDSWLKTVRSTPERLSLDEKGKTWDQIVKGRLSLLDANPAIKAKYLGTPDWLNRYGLPSSKVETVGNANVVRLQRAVIQEWKVNTPWAKAGEVTVANGGDIGKEAGLYPKDAAKPEGATIGGGSNEVPRNPGALTVVIDPGHGGKEPGAVHRFANGSFIYEDDINLKVALTLEKELARLGYKVVMTRRTDAKVGLADDLQARVDVANSAKADILVSIHHNGIGREQVSGTEVYYCEARPFANDSRDLAIAVQAGLMSAYREKNYTVVDRGYKDDSKAVGKGNHYRLLGPKSKVIVRPSLMPAIIGEGLFVSNNNDAELLRQEGFLSAEARGYVLGINRYFASRGK